MNKMKKCHIVIFLFLLTLAYLDGKKLSKSRSSSSSRSSSRKTSSNSQPVPTSHSYSQSASKPTLFGWQEKPAHRSQNKPTQTHSYPSSQTGMSGNSQKQPTNQHNIQKSNSYPQSNSQSANHGYPSSNTGLSGQSGTGVGYPSQQGGGLSGNSPKQPSSNQEGVQRSNSYPQNNAYPSNQQNHGYPASNGLSGQGGTGGNSFNQGAPPPYSGSHYPNSANNYGNTYRQPQGPPPPYQGNVGPSYGGYGGYHSGSQMPGYFGNYGNTNGKGFGGMSRSGSALTGVGIAGAGVGTLLTGLALWNLARSTGSRHHTVIYDRGQPVAVAPADNSSNTGDSILGELINCTLTISNINVTEVLAIPCAIATSFSPESDVKDSSQINNKDDSTTCTVTVVTKAEKEFSTTIPCSLLLNTAAENNVTEGPPIANSSNDFILNNDTVTQMNNVSDQPSDLIIGNSSAINTTISNCTLLEPGTVRDPINPCYAITHNVTVRPLMEEINTQANSTQ